ncbi:NXPE family member 1-like [Dreissena polymorpha]|uniref:NXPE C-terminal domain-containing protein n=1 Tax=Dreissena polymorpha TaxID=45954 RepID=A0A9D3YVN2_DREPO|nr:NXPE family member 1-like [Dreissena polymorpha]KAH3707923.1 hypothetical protein DPMN_067343 [Dreissena polymorpha]
MAEILKRGWKFLIVSTLVFITVLLLFNVQINPYLDNRQNVLVSNVINVAASKRLTSSYVTEGPIFNENTYQKKNVSAFCAGVDIYGKPQLTSVVHSRIDATKLDPTTPGLLYVYVSTYTKRNVSKTSGGDVINMIANEVNGDGKITAFVFDHNNGKYSGVFQVPWTGKTAVRVKVLSFVENACLRLKSMEKYGNQVFTMQSGWGIRGKFVTSRGLTEFTPCGANDYIFGYPNQCNFTSVNANESWFCGQPRHSLINCRDIYSFGTGPFESKAAGPSEKVALPNSAALKSSVTANSPKSTEARDRIPCNERPPRYSWTELGQFPNGYWARNQWRMYNCSSSLVHSVKSYRNCLQNKTVYFLGDSTVRQYAEYFINTLLGYNVKNFKDMVGSGRQYHSKQIYKNFGINVTYIKHAMPFHNPDFPPTGITSLPMEIERLSNSDIPDKALILVVNYHVHFQAYPVDIFRGRVRSLAQSLSIFLQAKPTASVLFKGFHACSDDTRWFDNKLTLIFRGIVKEEFGELKDRVVYLDTWSITAAHDSLALHPAGNAFTSQIQQFLTYVC